MKLRGIITQMINYLKGIEPEGKIVYTVTSNNLGELIDAQKNFGSKLVEPFKESPEQNYWYYTIEVKDNIVIKVQSQERKLKNE